MMIVVDKETSLILTGMGDVLEPENGIAAIGSGGDYAKSAACALLDVDGYDAEDIVRKSMSVAADICVFSNHNITIETLE